MSSPGPQAFLIKQSPWLVLVAAAVGAPIEEELLFRGFLFPALARSSLGAVGGAIVSSALWAGTHTTHAWYALVQVFLIGLLHSWARLRSDSLWPCIITHAMFNGALTGLPMLVRLGA